MRVPKPLLWLWKKWMAISHVIGKVMSTIILSLFWCIGIGAYALVMKLIPKRRRQKGTYWIPIEAKTPDFHYQF